jgi:hypothetical protein
MKKLTGKLEELFINITFTEEREFTAAREALKRASQKIEDTRTAITFAEAGEFETAVSYINKGGRRPKSRRIRSSAKGHTRLCTGRA